MKNKIIIMVLAGVFITGYYFSIQKKQEKNEETYQEFRIAIFQPATHPALDEIAQGFIDTFKQFGKKKYRFDRYNPQGNKILMQAQAQDILQKKYDLIFTIGVGCSVTMKDLSSKKLQQTPIVFTAVDDPERLDLQGINITGVIDNADYENQLNLLMKIQPTIKRVLLVYDQAQASGLEKDRKEIERILKFYDVQLMTAEILHISEIAQKVTPLIHLADAIMILKDNTAVSGLDSLIQLCQRYHVLLLASDLNSGEKGAALSYGIHEAESGIQAAYQALKIVDDGKIPSQLPIVSVQNMKMIINCAHAKNQGLVIDERQFDIPGVELINQGNYRV